MLSSEALTDWLAAAYHVLDGDGDMTERGRRQLDGAQGCKFPDKE